MKLARANTVLLVLIIGINGYILLLPVAPSLLFWLDNRDGQKTAYLESLLHKPAIQSGSNSAAPKENRLIIPSMLLDEPIHEGKTEGTLRKGLWHRPSSSNPEEGSNMVIAGHRLTYSNPKATLYHLDRVTRGDNIGVWWEGKRYLYTVTEVKTVPANEIGIEKPTRKARLTIYTCTPLWLPRDRLVVIAEPMETQ